MTPSGEDYSDDFVAGALKREALASSIKYSAVGLEAFRPKRPIGANPKPNTRFLASLLKDTDSHNAALLDKEQREAREKQRKLARAAGAPQSAGPKVLDRFRDYEDYQRKRRREDTREPENDEKRLKRRRSASRSPQRSSKSTEDRHDKHRSRRHRHDSVEEEERSHRRSQRSPDHGERSRRHRHKSAEREGRSRRYCDRDDNKYQRQGSTEDRGARRNVKRDNHRPRHRSSESRESSRDISRRRGSDRPQVERSAQSSHKGSQREPRDSGTRSNRPSEDSNTRRHQPQQLLSDSASDSDPLEAIVGPLPPPRPPSPLKRGRGAFAARSAMDTRFDSNYDPSIDVQPDPETEDDWEQALEAMRDRVKWKQQGADRLRAAGFTDTEVKKWEKGDKKDEEDVRWAKKGEGREWDRGKVVDGDGAVELKAEWGRLT